MQRPASAPSCIAPVSSDASAPDSQPSARPGGIVGALSPYLFYGWIVVGLGFIVQIFTSLAMQGLSTYVGPLQREFGWSATATATGRSFQQADTFLGPLNGWLVDRFGPRRVMSVGVVLFALSFVLFSFGTELWAFYAACLLMAIANSLVGLLVVSSSINRWFRRKRTMAIGLAVVGFAAAGAIFIPLIVWAQNVYGWRAAAMGTALGMLLLGIPIMLLMRDGPEPYGLLPDGDKAEPAAAGQRRPARGGGLVNFTLKQSLQTRTFWLLTAASTLAMFVQSAVVVHQFPYLEELLDRETAALVLSEMNLFNIAGRLLGGVLGDRMSKSLLMGLNMLLMGLGLVAIALGTSLVLLLLYGAFFGLSWGIRAAVQHSLQGDYFGRAAYGRIAGLMQTFASPGAILSPLLVGVLIDRVGGYRVPFAILGVLALLGSVLYMLAQRPPDPVRAGKPSAA